MRLDFDQTAGALVLLRTPRQAEAVRHALAATAAAAARPAFELLDAAACRRLEPALATGLPLHGGVLLPAGGAGNGRQLAHLLKAQAQRHGARFEFNAAVQRLLPGTPARLEIAGAAARAFDAVVVCAGAASHALLEAERLHLPLHTGYGYSVTAPLAQIDDGASPGPRAALIDARSGITIARLGHRVRVAGVAEFSGDPGRLDQRALRRLYSTLEAHFPGAAVLHEAQHWKGAVTRLPDGAPLIGASGLPGIWLNLGHGGHGWSLACAAAQRLADQMAGNAAGGTAVGSGDDAFGIGRLR